MKYLDIFLIILFSSLLLQQVRGNDSLTITGILSEFQVAYAQTATQFERAFETLSSDLRTTDQQIQALQSHAESNTAELVRLLIHKIEIKEELEKLENSLELDITKLRFKKGLELIRMLYEKILALDHHFSSLQTYQNVVALSNPNAFPEFQRSQEVLQQRLKKDNMIKLPGILNSNPYLSSTVSIISSFIGGGQTQERENDLDNIACIIDFTARMNSELTTIYYETEFLKESNIALKEECLELFKDYTKVIKYYTELDVCRREDDWENVYESLDNLILELEELTESDLPSDKSKLLKRQIDLEFSVDRLLSFINKYNAFISNGEKYYQKFEIIVSNYPNEEICENQLPTPFRNLKSDIQSSIEKFNQAYNIAALKGSKLKDLLYGYSTD